MKRLTKAQREERDREALRVRVTDMLWGAVGGLARPTLDPEEDGGLVIQLGMEVFGRWLGAVQAEWSRPAGAVGEAGDGKVPHFVFDFALLGEFETLEGAVERLFGMGARA